MVSEFWWGEVPLDVPTTVAATVVGASGSGVFDVICAPHPTSLGYPYTVRETRALAPFRSLDCKPLMSRAVTYAIARDPNAGSRRRQLRTS
jgi:hypothetical protein